MSNSGNDNRQQRRAAELTLAQEVDKLLAHNDDDGLRWTGSKRDLMEALHIAFTTGRIIDEQGCGLSFIRIVSQACRVLHMPVPSNPYQCARRGSSRKGIIRPTYIDRYSLLLFTKGNPAPLSSEIATRENRE